MVRSNTVTLITVLECRASYIPSDCLDVGISVYWTKTSSNVRFIVYLVNGDIGTLREL